MDYTIEVRNLDPDLKCHTNPGRLPGPSSTYGVNGVMDGTAALAEATDRAKAGVLPGRYLITAVAGGFVQGAAIIQAKSYSGVEIKEGY